MDFLLVRVDDRLLHGQVVFGWGRELNPGGYLIVDDTVAGDSWERDAFEAAAPPEAPVTVIDLNQFIAQWADWPEKATTVVLLRGLSQLAAAAAGGFLPNQPVNLGGLHGSAHSREYLTYLHLTPEDETILTDLIRSGIPLEARDLPGSAVVTSDDLLERLRGR
jgi:D-glucosaminate PTS system EIIB component